MLWKSLFDLERGTYHRKGSDWVVVVSEITTHRHDGLDSVALPDPLVTFRDLIMKNEAYVTYSMTMTEFKEKFQKI